MLLPEASCCTHDYHHVVCERGRRCLDSEHLAAIAGAGTFFIRTEHSPCERQQQGQAQEELTSPRLRLRGLASSTAAPHCYFTPTTQVRRRGNAGASALTARRCRDGEMEGRRGSRARARRRCRRSKVDRVRPDR
jgi:hypothetical protein